MTIKSNFQTVSVQSIITILAALLLSITPVAMTAQAQEGPRYSDPGPQMKLLRMKPVATLYASSDLVNAESILKGYKETLSPSPKAVQTGMDLFFEAYDLTAVSATFTEEMLGSPIFKQFNAISGELGVLFSLHKFSQEIFEGNDDNAKLNLSKSLTLYSVGKWGSKGLKIANIGIFFIDYSLTKFGTRGLEVREERYQKIYDNYNQHHNPFRKDQNGWTTFIIENTSKDGDFKSLMENELKRYLNACFDEEGSMIPDDVRTVLTKKERLRILDIIKPSVDKAVVALKKQQLQEMTQQLNKLKNLLNNRYQIRVNVYGGEHDKKETIERISNLPVRVVVNKDQPLWAGQTSAAGQWFINFTWLGYRHYQKPAVVELDYQGETLRQPIQIRGGRFEPVRFQLDAESSEPSESNKPDAVSIIEPLVRKFSPEPGTDQSVNFVARSKNSGHYRYLWNFGDGTQLEKSPATGEPSQASHTFKSGSGSKEYTVSVDLQEAETGKLLAKDTLTIKIETFDPAEYDYEAVLKRIPDFVTHYDDGNKVDYAKLTPVVQPLPQARGFNLYYVDSKGRKHGREIQLGTIRDFSYVQLNSRYEGIRNGRYVRWLSNGIVLFEYEYRHGKEFGLRRLWHPDGTLKYEGRFENDQKVGLHREWFENGTRLSQSMYPYGSFTRWHFNGQKQVEGATNNQGNHGAYTEWYEDGQIRVKGNYVNGKMRGKWVEYTRDGKARTHDHE
jgi:hypothetical protein